MLDKQTITSAYLNVLNMFFLHLLNGTKLKYMLLFKILRSVRFFLRIKKRCKFRGLNAYKTFIFQINAVFLRSIHQNMYYSLHKKFNFSTIIKKRNLEHQIRELE